MTDPRPGLPGSASHEAAPAAGASLFTGRNVFSLARLGSLFLRTLVHRSKHRAAVPKEQPTQPGLCTIPSTVGRIQTCPPASTGQGRPCVRTRKAIAAENERKGKCEEKLVGVRRAPPACPERSPHQITPHEGAAPVPTLPLLLCPGKRVPKLGGPGKLDAAVVHGVVLSSASLSCRGNA